MATLISALNKVKEVITPKTDYQQNVSTPVVQNTNTKPTTSQAMAQMMKITQTDPQRGYKLQQDFQTLQADNTSMYYNPYTKPTNQAVLDLGAAGFDVSKVDDDWLNTNSYLKGFYNATGVTNNPSKPGNKASQDEVNGYNYWQVLQAREDTNKAKQESAALKDELIFKATKDVRNMSDEEIMNSVDWKKYPTLANMIETANEGAPMRLNEAVDMATDDWMGAVIWGARNNGGTGSIWQDMGMNADGSGNMWQDNEDIRNRLSYAPYTVGSTMYDACMYYNRTSFDEEWLEANRPDGSDATENAYWNSIYDAVKFTNEAQKQLDEANAWLDKQLETAENPEDVMKAFDKRLNGKWGNLKSLDDSTVKVGKLINTSDKIDYSYADVQHRVEDACARNSGRLDGRQTLNVYGVDVGTDQSEAATAAADSNIKEANTILDEDATASEQNQLRNAPSITTGLVTGAIQNVFSTINDQVQKILNPKVTGQYVSTYTSLYAGTVANHNARAELDNLNAANEKVVYACDAARDIYKQIALGEYNGGTDIGNALLDIESGDNIRSTQGYVDLYNLMTGGNYEYGDHLSDGYTVVDKGKQLYEHIVNDSLSYEEDEELPWLLSQFTSKKEELENTIAETAGDEVKLSFQEKVMDMRIAACDALGLDSTELRMGKAVSSVLPEFADYEATVWSSYSTYELMRIENEENGVSLEETLQEAALGNYQIEMRLENARAIKEYIEEHNIQLPDNYISNLDRNIAKLERSEKDYNYFAVQAKDDFHDMAQKGRELEQAESLGDKYDNYTPEERERLRGSTVRVARGLDNADYVDLFTDAEKDTFYYLYATEGFKAASDYYNYMTDGEYGVIHTRNAERTQENVEEEVNRDFWSAAWANTKAILSAPLDALSSGVYILGTALTGKEYNPYNAARSFSRYSTGVNAATSKAIKDNLGEGSFLGDIAGGLYEIIYNRGRSAVNFAVTTALTGGISTGVQLLDEIFGAFPMAIDAAGNAIANAKINHAEDWQAYAIGAVTAIAESFTEGITYGNIKDALSGADDIAANTVKDLLKNWLTSSGVEEMIGETANDIIENLGDDIIMGALSEHNSLVDQYIQEMGADPNDPIAREKAEQLAREDELAAIAHTAIISYLSPGLDVITGSGKALINDIHNIRSMAREAKANGQDVSFNDMVKEYRSYKQAAREQANQWTAQAEVAQTEAAPEKTVAEAPAAPRIERTASEADEAFLRDLNTLDSAMDSDVNTQTAAMAAFFGGEQGTDSGDAANATAVALPNVFGNVSEAIASVKNIAAGARASGVEINGVKQALQISALSPSSKTGQLVQTDTFKTATPEEQARMLVETAQADVNDQNVVNEAAKTVLENRIAEREKQIIADGALDVVRQAQQKADDAIHMVALANDSLAEKRGITQAKSDAVAQAANEMTANPTADNEKLVHAALNELQSATAVEKEYEEHLEAVQRSADEAQSNLNRVREDTFAKIRQQAEADIAQETQQRAEVAMQQAEQAKVEAQQQEQARLDQEEQNNFARAQADAIIAENYANATDEQKQKIRDVVKKISTEKQMTETEKVLARADYVKRIGKKFGYDIRIGDTTEGGRFLFQNASVNPNTGVITLSREATLSDAMYAILGHEVTHIAQQSGMYDELANALIKLEYGEDTARMQADIDARKDLYTKGLEQLQQQGKNVNPNDVTPEYARQELVADLMGKLFLDENGNANVEMLNRFAAESPNVAVRVLNAIKSFLKKLAGIEGAPITEAQRIVDTLETALKSASKNNGEERYSFEMLKKVSDAVREKIQYIADHSPFAKEYKTWNKTKDSTALLTLGHASDLLQSYGVPDTDIKLSGGKIIDIKSKHPAMTDNVIRQIPSIIDDPILIMKSKTRPNDTITVFGELVDKNGYPVLAALAITPTLDEKTGVEFTILRSAYGKDQNPQGFINDSDILYSDEKRADSWAATMGLQLPSGHAQIGSSEERLSLNGTDVKPIAVDDNGNTIAVELPGDTVAVAPAERFSLNSFTKDEQERVRNALLNKRDSNNRKVFTKAQVDQYLKDATGIASLIATDKARWDFVASDNQVFLKPNADYYFTLDASTLCAKRLLYQGTFDYVQHALPDEVFTPEDLIDLVNIMADMGYETPCGICYVESRRRWLDTYANKFLNELPEDADAFIDKYFEKAAEEDKATIRDHYSEWVPATSIDDLTTSDGLEKLRHDNPYMYKAFVKAMNAKGTANPKVVQLRTEYRGDIGKLSKNDVQKVKDIGGLRIQSFSDFETPHLLDMMQAVLDMSSVGLTSQAYTKVPNFAWVFGDTGIKINLSLIGEGTGLDENGNLVFDNREGINFDEAMKLRERYGSNVGTILVGINDEHIVAAMGDPRIDFIIPFHKSGWSDKELKGIKSLNNYRDYTDTQNERYIIKINDDGTYETESFKKHKERTKESLENFQPVGKNGYWNFKKSGQWNAENYLKMCAEQHRIPKFNQFLVDNGDGSFSLPKGTDKRSTAIREGYWKTLIDFKMYESDSYGRTLEDGTKTKVKGAAQKEVTPNVNMAEAYRVMNDYQLGRQMPDQADGTKGKFIPMESNNSVPVATPAGDAYIEMIRLKRAGNKPVAPGPDTLEADLPVNPKASAFGASPQAPAVLGNTEGTAEESAAQQQRAMAIDAETGETVERFSLPTTIDEAIDNMFDEMSTDELWQLLGLGSDVTEEEKENVMTVAVKDIKDEFDPTIYNGKLYVKPDTLDYWLSSSGFASSNPNYAQAYITTMNPADFLRMTTVTEPGQRTILDEAYPLDTEKLSENAKRQPIQLIIDEDSGKIEGHEGRHRAVALSRAGVTEIPVLLFDSNTKYGKTPKDSMELKGQDFWENVNGNTITFNNVIPLSGKYRGEIFRMFTASAEEEAEAEANNQRILRYSLPSDAPYLSAVNHGNIEEAQRLVDERSEEAGYVIDGYHGTVNGGYTIFDKQKAHIGGNSGAGFYFSSNRADSEANYADIEGADNHFKVEHLVEKIQEYISESGENEYAGVPIPEDASYEDLKEIAKKMLQGNPQTYHVRLNPGKAYIRDGNNSTNLVEDIINNFDESLYSRDDYDSEDDYYDSISMARSDEIYEAISNAVYNGIADVDSNFEIVSNVDYDKIINDLAMVAIDYEKLTMADLIDMIGRQEIDAIVGDGEEAADATIEIARAIVEAFGFDSIEDREVGWKFNQLKNMKNLGGGDTVHYIMFHPNQIKLADPVTYDNEGNVIPLSERFKKENNDIRYSLPSDNLLEQQLRYQMQNRKLTQEDIDAYQQKTSRPLEAKSAKWSQTEGPAQRQFATGMLQESDEIAQQAKDYALAHSAMFPDTNAKQIERAINWIRENGSRKNADGSYTQTTDGFSESLEKATSKSFDYRSADGQARIVALMGMAVAKNDVMAQVTLNDAFSRQGTDIARALQARKLFRLMTPEGRISALQKMLQNTQDEINAKGSNLDLKFSDWIYQAAAVATEEGDFQKVQQAAAIELAEQLPANWKDRIRSLRMLSMLANPRTHIRNIIGNAFFIPAVGLKNKLGAIAELGLKQGEKTKTLSPFLSKEARLFARKDAQLLKDTLTGEAKYNEDSMVQRAQKPFNGLLQAMIDLNGNALEAEDWFFLKGHYRRALGSWMMANGYTAAQLESNQSLLEQGRAYAVQEAQKATYRDFNKLAQTLNKISRDGGPIGFAVDAILPFKKTPANILRRGVEYSPAGIMRSLTTDLYHLKQWNDYQNGKLNALPDKAISPSQFIDRLCSGLSGTAIMAVGALLSSAGVVSVGLDDDDDKIEKEKGAQKYAIKFSIGGKDFTYTMDWAAPMSMPFFVGAAIQEQAAKEGDFDVQELVNAFGNITEPVFNLSMLDGVNTLFKTSQNDDTNTLTQIGAKVLSNYATSYVPSILGAIARTIDPNSRKAFVESGKGKGILGTFRYAREQTENKIPFLNQTNIPVRDIWGNAQTSSLAERLIENFISPGYINEYKDDPLLNEIGRVYDLTGDKSLVPSDPAKSYTRTKNGKKETFVLTAEQWDHYKEVRGQTAFEVLSNLIDTEDYQSADASVQAQMIKDAWSYADAIGKSTFIPDYEIPKMGSNPEQIIAKDATISGYKSEMIKALNAGDWEAYDTMVEALKQADVEDSTIKTKIGDTYRDQWKAAYRKDDEAKMAEIEEILDNTGFEFNIYGKNGWMDKVDQENE